MKFQVAGLLPRNPDIAYRVLEHRPSTIRTTYHYPTTFGTTASLLTKANQAAMKEIKDRFGNFYDEHLRTSPILIPRSILVIAAPGHQKACKREAAIMPAAHRKSSSKEKHGFIKDNANTLLSIPRN